MAILTTGRNHLFTLFALTLIIGVSVSLYLISQSLHSESSFAVYYTQLLFANIVGIFLLSGLVLYNLWKLYRGLKTKQPGAHLTYRFTRIFVAIGLIPVILVFWFSFEFMQRNIDSWFQVKVDETLEKALQLGQAALDIQVSNAFKQVQRLSRVLEQKEGSPTLTLLEARGQIGAEELNLLNSNNLVIASSSEILENLAPTALAEHIIIRASQGQPYVGIDTINDKQFVQIARQVKRPNQPHKDTLHALFSVKGETTKLSSEVEVAFNRHKKLVFLREALKRNFSLAMFLALGLCALTAVWLALVISRRLFEPIGLLAQGTRAVASGNYTTELPNPGKEDDLSFLVQSFNDMTVEVAKSQKKAQSAQMLAEHRQQYLTTVLKHLSSGVITLSDEGIIITVNDALGKILDVPKDDFLQQDVSSFAELHPNLSELMQTIINHNIDGIPWQEELRLFSERGRQVLMLRGTPLTDENDGFVVMVEDITQLIKAERDAAWSEAARRLAHEINNPLTPIQLSAQRLQRKLDDKLNDSESKLLKRATQTITQQVDDLKRMVNDFSDYARAPNIEPHSIDLNHLINSVADLHRAHRIATKRKLSDNLPIISGDTTLLRQVLNNLITNAQQSIGEKTDGMILIQSEDEPQYVQVTIQDNGEGFGDKDIDSLFEPYITHKEHGSGLGLAIVKKIIEDHNGVVFARNRHQGGAEIILRLPKPIESDE